MKQKPIDKAKRIKIALYTGAAAFILFLIILLGLRYSSWIVQTAREPEQFRDLLLSYGRANILVFILFQIIQVVVATIPGELVQIAGGYMYGIAGGTLYSLIGIMGGYIVVFFIVRVVGYPLVKFFVAENKIEKMRRYLLSAKGDAVIFLLFLIPGLPKDFLVYIIGLTPVKPLRFFVLVTIARFPAMLGASYIGATIEQQNYPMVAVALIISIVLFLVGFFLRDKILRIIEQKLP